MQGAVLQELVEQARVSARTFWASYLPVWMARDKNMMTQRQGGGADRMVDDRCQANDRRMEDSRKHLHRSGHAL